MVSRGHRNVVLSKNDFTRNFHYQIDNIIMPDTKQKHWKKIV